MAWQALLLLLLLLPVSRECKVFCICKADPTFLRSL
jgi:hypothetical protein